MKRYGLVIIRLCFAYLHARLVRSRLFVLIPCRQRFQYISMPSNTPFVEIGRRLVGFFAPENLTMKHARDESFRIERIPLVERHIVQSVGLNQIGVRRKHVRLYGQTWWRKFSPWVCAISGAGKIEKFNRLIILFSIACEFEDLWILQWEIGNIGFTGGRDR